MRYVIAIAAMALLIASTWQWAWNWLSAHTLAIGIVGGILLVAVCLIASYVANAGRRQRKALLAEVGAQVQTHIRTLSIKRKQLSSVDDYGNASDDKWHDHIDYFLDKVVGFDAGNEEEFREDCHELIERLLDSHDADGPGYGIEDIRSGVEYEMLCKELLERAGWEVATTPASGDQGADLIAQRAAVRIAIQCKFHGKPVGNKAVQEVFAARDFVQANFAAVVSKAPYTKAAIQLARSNGVLLLHHDDLEDLARHFMEVLAPLTATPPRRNQGTSGR